MGRLEVPENLLEEIEWQRFTSLNMNFEHARRAGALPDIHKDPFDRMLIAQAQIENLTLVTRDDSIARYDVRVLGA